MTARRTPRLAAVVLAAGEGRRFGAIKQLATFRGQPLVCRTIDAARNAGAKPIVVVLGAHANAIEPVLRDTDVRITMNDAWASGIASSLRAGIAAVLASNEVDGVLILTIDQPLVDATMLRSLIDAFGGARAIVASRYAETIGIPVVIGRAHLADLSASVAGDRGAGAWLRARGSAVTTVDLPAAAHDADTIDTLHAMERSMLA